MLDNITTFLLELGAGFAFIGRQKTLQVGVSNYQLTQSLPDDFKSSLPSIEEIEAELNKET